VVVHVECVCGVPVLVPVERVWSTGVVYLLLR
jgi:hypothetical protein